jgi:hypothetical protein
MTLLAVTVRLSACSPQESGIESVWVSEHPVLADPRQPLSPMDPGGPILDAAFLVGRTRSVRLGTGVIVPPLRNLLCPREGSPRSTSCQVAD